MTPVFPEDGRDAAGSSRAWVFWLAGLLCCCRCVAASADTDGLRCPLRRTVQELQMAGINFKAFDLGGHEIARRVWKDYYAKVRCG